MTVDQASKLKGDLSWMYSNCAGQLGKLAGPLLTNEIMTLRLLLHTLLRAHPWDVDVSITPRTNCARLQRRFFSTWPVTAWLEYLW